MSWGSRVPTEVPTCSIRCTLSLTLRSEPGTAAEQVQPLPPTPASRTGAAIRLPANGLGKAEVPATHVGDPGEAPGLDRPSPGGHGAVTQQMEKFFSSVTLSKQINLKSKNKKQTLFHYFF